jgi:hypothetical protein
MDIRHAGMMFEKERYFRIDLLVYVLRWAVIELSQGGRCVACTRCVVRWVGIRVLSDEISYFLQQLIILTS